MKNDYGAAWPELWGCLLIKPYLSLLVMRQNPSVCERQLTEDDGVRGKGGAFTSRRFEGNNILEGTMVFSLSLFLSHVKNENYKEDNNKNSKMSGQAEASPLLKAALGFVVKMCCLLQKHASPPAQNKWAVPDIFTSNCSSVCGESYSLSRQLRPVHLRDRRGTYPETGGRKQHWTGSWEDRKCLNV